MQPEISTIREGIRTVTSSVSPIPVGELRDAVHDVMATVARNHRYLDATDEDPAYCEWCRDEWPCPDVRAVHKLARVITRMAEDAATTYLPGRSE